MIEQLAKDEYIAWKARNSARNAFRDFLRKYRADHDEYFDRADAVASGEDDAEVTQFDILKTKRDETTKGLASARTKLRRAVRLSLKPEGGMK